MIYIKKIHRPISDCGFYMTSIECTHIFYPLTHICITYFSILSSHYDIRVFPFNKSWISSSMGQFVNARFSVASSTTRRSYTAFPVFVAVTSSPANSVANFWWNPNCLLIVAILSHSLYPIIKQYNIYQSIAFRSFRSNLSPDVFLSWSFVGSL